MPARLDISGHFAGDTWLGLSGDFFLNGNPLNLSGASIVMQIRKSPDWPHYAYEWSTQNNSILIPNITGNSIYVSSGVINVPPHDYHYDIEITLSDGFVVTPIAGIFPISGSVTK